MKQLARILCLALFLVSMRPFLGFAASSRAPAPNLPGPVSPTVSDYQETVERDFPLRTLGELRVTNVRGAIHIEGWSQDRIRLKGVRHTRAASPEEAKQNFAATDFRFKHESREIELTVEYGRGLKIEERLKERKNPVTYVDVTILAPANLPVRIWGVDGKVSVQSWSAPVEARTSSGAINIESIKKGGVTALCPDCPVTLHSVAGPVRCMGGQGALNLSDVSGPQVYVETENGNLSLDGIRGEQLYVSKSGSITGKNLNGRIEFHTREGNVDISRSSGFLSGKSDTGSIIARMQKWEFLDKALIESRTGEIRVFLPKKFSGEVDLHSDQGSVSSAFSLFKPDSRSEPISAPLGGTARRISGIAGEGGELLKLTSQRGDVFLLRSDE